MTKETKDLNPAAPLTGTELVHVVQGGNSRKAAIAAIAAAVPPGPAGGNVMAVGLLKNMNGANVLGADRVMTSGNLAVGDGGGGSYAKDATVDLATYPKAGFTDAGGQKYRVLRDEPIVPQKFIGATDPDWTSAIQAAADYLHSLAIARGNYGNSYGGSQPLDLPAGDYPIHDAISFQHTLKVIGAGSGRFGPGGGGATQIRQTAMADGFQFQFATTAGDAAVVAGHDGCGGAYIDGVHLKGPGRTGADAGINGLVGRSIISGRDVLCDEWPGRGLKLHGAQSGAYVGEGGNVSMAHFTSSYFNYNHIGIDCAGNDANIISFLNCGTLYNERMGVRDDSGIGDNIYIGHHASANGLLGTGVNTQCSYMGLKYALKIGGDPTVAPSGDNTDTVNWAYIEVGPPILERPAWNALTPFVYGGDYVTGVSNPNGGAVIAYCYSEEGGFSLFGLGTMIDGGTISDRYYRGGVRWRAETGGGRAAMRLLADLILNGGLTIADDVNGALVVGRYNAGNPAIIRASALAPYLTLSSPDGTETVFIENGGLVEIFANLSVQAGHAFRIGGTDVLNGQMAAIADLGAAPTQADFNGLLAKLRGVKLLAP